MKKIILIICLCCALFGYMASFSQNQREITLNKNQCYFEIKDFDENPSTGYEWSIKEYDTNIFIQPQKDFNLNMTQAGMVGVGGKASFKFVMLKSACNDANLSSTKIIFTLARAWEQKDQKTKTIEVKFNY